MTKNQLKISLHYPLSFATRDARRGARLSASIMMPTHATHPRLQAWAMRHDSNFSTMPMTIFFRFRSFFFDFDVAR